MLLLFAVAIHSGSLQAGLIISEIMYKPSGANNTTPTDEWFELFNGGTSTVNLTTIKFKDALDASTGVTLNNGVRVTSPTTTVASTGLAVGAYAVVGNKSLAAWQTVFGSLPVGATYVQLGPGRTLQTAENPSRFIALPRRPTSSLSTTPILNGMGSRCSSSERMPRWPSPLALRPGNGRTPQCLAEGLRETNIPLVTERCPRLHRQLPSPPRWL